MFEEEADDEDGEPLPWPPKLKLGRRGRADEPRVLEPNMWSCLSPNTGLVRVKDQQLALADSSADESELPLTPQLTPRAVDYNYHLPIRLRFQSSAGSRKSAKTTKKVPPPLDLSRSKPVVWSQPDVGSRLGVLEEDDREYEAEEEDMSLGETTSESVVSTEEEYDVTPFTRDNSVKSSASSAGDSVEGPRLKKYYMEKYARPQQQSRASYVSILRRGL
ncbi:hypothetical protein JAAARDRAFT_34009 [Jaapia argillacea MUCL 33604]|uniref:Uncharacterized protein n=1 Tax=Jaapia argillacea MUCL 33604 TaxID=933084 RepID=A0A067PX27_9AGAM|nr:hypothetical protein JAAARDRAFT_34009 [Jaapia argillacea MUCL 33604]